MSWFNRYIIGAVSPKWALARERYGRGLHAFYEAAEPSRLRKSRPGASANATNERSARKLIDKARHLEENLDIASGALDVLVSNTVGSGIMPEPLVETMSGELAEDFNQGLLKLYDDWIHSPEVTRELDYYSLQRLEARSWFRDGEGFGQKLIGRISGLNHGTVLPYSLEAFECDFIPLDLTDPGRNIRQGIEVDMWGRPVRYHRYRTHPGDGFGGLSAIRFDTVPMPAERVLHLKMVKRLHQLRGVTVFASTLARFDDIKEIDENERVAARVAAAMAAYIKKGLPDDYTVPQRNPDGTPKLREMEFIPGIIFDDLQPGEEVGTIDTKRPNNALIPFRDAQLRSAAAGLMCSYSSLSKNYNGTWSSQRQELVEQFNVYRALSGQFVFRWCQPVWDGFIDAVLASGALSTSGIDLETVYNVSHTAPPMPWIDPEKEMNAFKMAEDNFYESKSSIIRKRGANPGQVYREIERDRQELERRGMKNEQASGDGPTRAELYGISVRAGAITPQLEDEERFRAEMGMPPMSDDAKRAWQEDRGVRRPVTLKDSGEGGQQATSDPDDPDAPSTAAATFEFRRRRAT